MTKSNRFSAFKLFYDEFIYNENDNVSYVKIKRYVDKIRNIVIDLRHFRKNDLDRYNVYLDRVNKRIKLYLNEIYKLEPKLFDYYYSLYKDNVSISNDTVKEMPFIISTSFYDDYRTDNKSFDEFYFNNVPKYSSIEKRQIRLDAKNKSLLEYFVYLLENSKYNSRYKMFIQEYRKVLIFKPELNETHFDFFKRLDVYFNRFSRLLAKLSVKAKYNGDYEEIVSKILIAYKRKIVVFEEDILQEIKEYFDLVFSEYKNSIDVFTSINIMNTIEHSEYLELKQFFIDEKSKYSKMFDDGRFYGVTLNNKSFAYKMREDLINSFFDNRYYVNFVEKADVVTLVNKTIDLYFLADVLVEQLFLKCKFDSAHSEIFKRGNDVNSSLYKFIYSLYDPYDLLKKYENIRKSIERYLDTQNDEYKSIYNSLVIKEKNDLNIHGPIPNIKNINTKLNDKKIEFIINNYKGNLYSLDKDYDTRNYDLSIIAEGISINDMASLYDRIKFSLFDGSLKIDYKNEDKIKLFEIAKIQKFICECIFDKLPENKVSTNSLKDICFSYLHDDVLFEDEEYIKCSNSEDNYDDYIKVRDKFNSGSNWSKFIKDNL